MSGAVPPVETPDRVDVAVVGAGPAGLAAGVRARWVKGHGAFPLRVALFDPAPPGGLAGWKPNLLTGPSWRLAEEDLPGRLAADLAALSVPCVPEPIESVRLGEDGRFELRRASGRRVRAEAVVLATGLRRLGDEREHFSERVSVTFQGADRFPALLLKAARAARQAGGPLVVVGHGETRRIAPLVVAAAGAAGVEVVWVLEDGEPGAGAAHVLTGRLASVAGLHRGRVTVRLAGGGAEEVHAGHVFLDYHAFEVRPSRCLDLVPDPARTASGHLRVDRECATTVPGLLAAGDCTGPYYAIARALGDGVTAGLSAWRHVYRRRFGREGPLFAYRADGRPLVDEARWVPEFGDDWAVDVLVPPSEFERAASTRDLPAGRLLAARPTAAAWRDAAGGVAGRLWESLLEARVVTLRPPDPEDT